MIRVIMKFLESSVKRGSSCARSEKCFRSTILCGKASILKTYYKADALMQVSNCSHRYQACIARMF